jgi:hypothetical protein
VQTRPVQPILRDTVELYADRTQALAVVDPEDRALTISCGAALPNLRVALRRLSYRDAALIAAGMR